jgi:hypothetical protein
LQIFLGEPDGDWREVSPVRMEVGARAGRRR